MMPSPAEYDIDTNNDDSSIDSVEIAKLCGDAPSTPSSIGGYEEFIDDEDKSIITISSAESLDVHNSQKLDEDVNAHCKKKLHFFHLQEFKDVREEDSANSNDERWSEVFSDYSLLEECENESKHAIANIDSFDVSELHQIDDDAHSDCKEMFSFFREGENNSEHDKINKQDENNCESSLLETDENDTKDRYSHVSLMEDNNHFYSDFSAKEKIEEDSGTFIIHDEERQRENLFCLDAADSFWLESCREISDTNNQHSISGNAEKLRTRADTNTMKRKRKRSIHQCYSNKSKRTRIVSPCTQRYESHQIYRPAMDQSLAAKKQLLRTAYDFTHNFRANFNLGSNKTMKNSFLLQAYNLVQQQHRFKREGKPTKITIAYHQTSEENAEKIRKNYQFSKKRAIVPSSKSGIHVANHPFSFSSGIIIMMAVLKGESCSIEEYSSEKMQSSDKRSRIDTILLDNKEAILRQNTRYLPLFVICADKLHAGGAEAAKEIETIESKIKLLLEKGFNDKNITSNGQV